MPDCLLLLFHRVAGRRLARGLALLLAGLLPLLSHAQVNLYTFSQSTGTYTPLPSPTVLATSTTSSVTTTDDVIYTITLPFAFTYNSVAYASGANLRISTNGFVTLGTTAPTTGNYAPISSTAGYAGAIAALGGDLYGSNAAGSLGELSYQTLGTSPNRTLVVQWKNYGRYSSGYLADNLNFQVQLDETTNVVRLVYGAFTPVSTATGPQVGLRGTSGVYNNRTTTTNWSASTAGSASTATMTLSSTVKPASGLTYTFTPPVPCTAPPTPGTAVATPANGCTSVSTTLTLSGSATGTGVTYQWQQSSTGAAGSYVNSTGTGNTAASFSTTVTSTTYFQALVTCSGQTAASTPVQVVVNPAAVPYASLPVTEGFESWLSRCGNREVPGNNWRATPITGNNSWRRNDQGFATAAWSYPGDEPTPYPTAASQGSYSARFHSYGTSSGTTGSLDLFADLSGSAGTKTLTFDYINPSGTDKLDVLLSTDGGATFPTTLLTLGTSAAFNGQSVVISSTSATAVVRFRATSDFGADDLGIDNLKLDVTPACAAVAFSPTTAITSNAATINFAAASGGSSYTLTYSPGGSTPQTVTPGAVNLTGLQPYTLYTVTITTNCGGGQTNTASTSFRTLIGNDECAGAVALTPGAAGAGCNAQTYTTLNATNSAASVTSACASPVGGDVWFSFVAAGPNHSITVVPTFDFDAVIDLRSGNAGCPGTSLSCQNASSSGGGAGTETLQANGLTPGATYYVRVYSTFASTSYNFDICITTPPNVACDPVTNAAVATASGTPTASTGTLTFTPASGAASYYLTLTPTAGGTTATATIAGSPVNLSGLTPSTSYTITITTNCSNGGVSNTVSVTFTSAAPPAPPANDDCAGAIALTPATTCSPTTGTTVGATTSTPASTCAGTADDDVWYSFVAGATTQTITVVGGTNFDAVVQLLAGTCGSLTSVSCADNTGTAGTETIAATGLTPGATYYVRVYEYYATGSSSGAPGSFTICVTQPADLVVDGTNSSPGSPYSASGTYNNVTINSGGTANLSGDLTVGGTLTINSGGTLNTAGSQVLGTGNFVLNAGGTLGIYGTGGISSSGTTGVIRNTGPARTFSPDASYVYNGVAAQNTGTGLPSQVRNLTTTNANAVTLTNPVSVTQVVTVAGAGNLVLNGQALTLLSNANGTALIVNSGAGIVSGGTGVAQRYLTTSNPGNGYRHYSAPVSNTTVADLAAGSFTPVVNPDYNTSPTPGSVRPYPTVFGYDQSRLASTSNNLATFDKGWYSPGATTDPMLVGQGYTVQLPGTALVDFVGAFTTGTQTVSLSRGPGADAGLALVGNPYPAPLDWSLLAASDRPGVDGAMYVFASSGPYAGSYRSYVNGQGGNPVVPMAQGFFVRVSPGQSSGSISFRNSHRLTAPDATTMQRTTADLRPQLVLELRTPAGAADAFYAYAEAGASDNFDSQLDATKLSNPTGLNLSSTATTGERLAIDGRAAFTAATELPLQVGVPAAGTYVLALLSTANLPANLVPYLRDASTGQLLPLVAGGASYLFSVTAAQAQALIGGRFALVFRPAGALAATPATLAAAVSVYPNPAGQSGLTVSVPAVAGATQVQAELLNALGQVVGRQTAALPTSGAALALPTAGLAPGVYVLHLTAGPATVTKRIVVE